MSGTNPPSGQAGSPNVKPTRGSPMGYLQEMMPNTGALRPSFRRNYITWNYNGFYLLGGLVAMTIFGNYCLYLTCNRRRYVLFHFFFI